MKSLFRFALLAPALCLLVAFPVQAQRQMEALGRGVVVLKKNTTQIYVGWRLLGDDPSDIAFNLYRSANGAAAVKVNAIPLTTTTDYLDNPGNLTTTAYAYHVRPVVGGVEQAPGAAATLAANAPTRQYLSLPLQPVAGGADGPYGAGVAWVGDFDGDGEYDFLAYRGSTLDGDRRQYLQAYKRDGTLLWQMDMGPNSLNQYSYGPGSAAICFGDSDFVTVYDMDGDGRAEVLVRTGDGTITGDGVTITAPSNTSYISMIDGLTGAEKARITLPNPFPSFGPLFGRFGIFYADGIRPSLAVEGSNRNPSTKAFNEVSFCFDFRDGAWSLRWQFIAPPGTLHSRSHQFRLADANNDGTDELVQLGSSIDGRTGLALYDTELVHGDRFHFTDIDPDRPGLETFSIQQLNPTMLATMFFDTATGQTIKKWYSNGLRDVGRGVVADLTSAHKGCEFYSTQPGIFNAKGDVIYANSVWAPEALWWDGDLLREFLDGAGSGATNPVVNKFNAAEGTTGRLYTFYNENGGVHQAYGGRAAFWGDILGDWREEIVVVANDYSELRIYNTTIPATNRLYTLMHNPQYRCQATTKAYVQSSYVDYYLGVGMTPPPPPPMVKAKLLWRGGAGTSTWDAGASPSWLLDGGPSTYADGDTVRFDLSGNHTTSVALTGTLAPGAVTVYSPNPYAFTGAGTLTGAMTLTKAGAGALTLPGTHSFTGATTVWDGALLVNGSLSGSPVTVWGGAWGGALAAGQTGGRIGGTGTFGQPVTVKYRGAVTPGASMGSAGTTTFAAGLTMEDGSTFALDLSDDPTGLAKANDRVAITGNLVLTGTVSIVIQPLNAALAPGTYTLATYTGALTGGLSNLAVTVPAGTPYTVALGGGALNLTVPVSRPPANLVWSGGVAGNTWDLGVSPNWLRAGSPDVFVSGDTVTFDATGSAHPDVTLPTVVPVAGLTVNASVNYTFSGPGAIGGPGGLTKSGTGTLTVNTTNTYTGPTVVTGGVLAVDNLDDGGSPSSIGASSASDANFVLNGGTLRLVGPQTNTNRNLTLGASGATFDLPGTSAYLQISGVLGGSGSLTKTGGGVLILAGNNTYSGGTFIRGGTLLLASSSANEQGLGSGLVTLDGGILSMSNVQLNDTPAWNLFVPAGSTGRLNADDRCSLNGSLTGGGAFTLYTGFIRTDLKGNWSAFTGTIHAVTDADGGDFRITNTFGYANAELNLGPEVFAYYNAGGTLTIPLGALSGDATSSLSGGSTAANTTTYQIGAKNTDSTYAGVIANRTGPVALTKVGSGTLTLTGAGTYTGATTISAGTLLIDGSLAGSAVTVQAGGGLGGAGTITGNVTLVSGARLVARLSGTPLAITGNLAASGTITVTGAVPGAGTYPILTYTGTFTGAPTLVWSGAGYTATFDTSVAGAISATFTSSGPRPAAALTWSGAASGAWDLGAINWKFTSSGVATSFVNGDTVRFDDTLAANPALTLAAPVEPAAVTFDAATAAYTLASAGGGLSGSAPLTKSGAARLTLTGANAYTGGTLIDGGILALGADGSTNAATVQHPGLTGGASTSLGSGTVTVTNGGQLRFGGRGGNTVYTYTTANPLVFDNGVLFSRDGLQALVGGLTINAGGATWTTMWNNKNLFINSPLSGVGPVVIDDASAGGSDTARGIVRIASAANSYAGTITINGPSTGFHGGVLQIENNTALLHATVINHHTAAAGLRFTVAAPAAQLGALGGSGDIVLPATSLTVGGNGASTTYTGALTGAGALLKSGPGTLTLTGTAHAHTGATTISAGTLALSGALTNASTVEVLSGATLHLTGSLTTGTLTIRAGGRLTGGGAVNATVVNEGLVETTGAGANFVFNGALTNAATGVLRFTAGAGFTLGGGGSFIHHGLLDILTAGIFATPTGGTGEWLTAESVQVTAFEFPTDGPPTLTVPTHAGHVYQLQRSTDLVAGAWENVGPPKSGTGAAQLFVDEAPPGGPSCFYRVLIFP